MEAESTESLGVLNECSRLSCGTFERLAITRGLDHMSPRDGSTSPESLVDVTKPRKQHPTSACISWSDIAHTDPDCAACAHVGPSYCGDASRVNSEVSVDALDFGTDSWDEPVRQLCFDGTLIAFDGDAQETASMEWLPDSVIVTLQASAEGLPQLPVTELAELLPGAVPPDSRSQVEQPLELEHAEPPKHIGKPRTAGAPGNSAPSKHLFGLL